MKNWGLKELMINHFLSLLSDELFPSAAFHWVSQRNTIRVNNQLEVVAVQWRALSNGVSQLF